MEILNHIEKLNKRPGEIQAHVLIRNSGAIALTQLGWPSKKSESWRYSPVQRLQQDFKPQTSVNSVIEAPLVDLTKLLKQWSSENFYHVIVQDKNILFCSHELEGKLEVLDLSEAFQKGHLDSSLYSQIDDGLEALNISFFEFGFYIKVANQLMLEKPVHWLQVYSSKDSSPLFQSRLVMDVQAKAALTFIETQVVLDEHERVWTNFSTNLHLAPHSQLTYIQWNELTDPHTHTARVSVKVGDHAHFHHLQVSTSEGWLRNDLAISCIGSGAEIIAHGVGFSRKQGIIDQQSTLTFKGPENKAEQICKNLLLDGARAIFNGKIEIQPEAQKTDSSQLHQSLLLSAQAEVDTKPELNIFADDVKATHGATVGQLSQDEVFYLQSRGLSKERSETLLCQAFLMDLCEKIQNQDAYAFLKSRIDKAWGGKNL